MARRGWRLFRIKPVQGGCWIEFVSVGPGVVDVREVWASWSEIPMVEMAGYFEPWIQGQVELERSRREREASLFD